MRYSQKLKQDLKKRLFNKNNELQLNTIKMIINTKILKDGTKTNILEAQTNEHMSVNKFVNCCLISERSRGTISEFYLSRHNFKKQIQEKKVPGFRKSSW